MVGVLVLSFDIWHDWYSTWLCLLLDVWLFRMLTIGFCLFDIWVIWLRIAFLLSKWLLFTIRPSHHMLFFPYSFHLYFFQFFMFFLYAVQLFFTSILFLIVVSEFFISRLRVYYISHGCTQLLVLRAFRLFSLLFLFFFYFSLVFVVIVHFQDSRNQEILKKRKVSIL